jgi:site-specific recombinase XerD
MIVEIITNYENHLKAFRYAENTMATYKCEFAAFLEYFKGEDYRYIPREKIIEYLARLYDLGYSGSKVNQAINAIKFYKEKVLRQKRATYFLKRPRRKKFIPPIISQDKMFEVIHSIRNMKHQSLIYTIYMNGLRISELRGLKLQDVRSKVEDPHIIIRNAKNDGKRLLYIDTDFVQKLRGYYLKYRPKVYLFEGAEPGEPISKTTIARILGKAMKSNGITERFRVHDLRHNFATHCLLNGTDIYALSKFLGHKSVETTEKYYAHLLPSEIKINRPRASQNSTKVITIDRRIRA